MLRAVSLDEVKNMTEKNIEILGLCETRWQGNNNFNSDKYRVITSGNKIQGLKRCSPYVETKHIINNLHVSDRLMLVKIITQTRSHIILQFYFPISSIVGAL